MMHSNYDIMDDRINPEMVYYDIEKDEIFLSALFDRCFFGLVRVNWAKVELLGEL